MRGICLAKGLTGARDAAGARGQLEALPPVYRRVPGLTIRHPGRPRKLACWAEMAADQPASLEGFGRQDRALRHLRVPLRRPRRSKRNRPPT